MFLECPLGDDSVRIRLENPTSGPEHLHIRRVHEAAFRGCEEADLVDELRGKEALVSLVAENVAGIVGHILFSRMWIQAPSTLVPAVALAPVAVLPAHQRKRIGERLILHGLQLLKNQGERIVIVVGHPNYYPRFGFSSAKATSLNSPFPREAFMAVDLVDGGLEGVHGTVVYPLACGL